MGIRRVGFVGIRTADLEAQAKVFTELLGLTPVRSEPTAVEYALGDGTRFELYGSDDGFHAFFETGPVVGFEVEDFDSTRSRMLAAGIAFIGDPQHENGTSWQHFRLPDGTIAEIIGPGRPLV